jgi:hypothetical protein
MTDVSGITDDSAEGGFPSSRLDRKGYIQWWEIRLGSIQ